MVRADLDDDQHLSLGPDPSKAANRSTSWGFGPTLVRKERTAP
jgi:hypothetical protein